ncbi:hypothetical protein GA0115251_10993 [Streptomyces sp. TverLS-915]|nr:hypothetical protein GA0115251_10993 [Streptomyces sp. TverLS-915]
MAPAASALLAALPAITLGILSSIPSLVIAVRRRRMADWPACAAFTAPNVAWVLQAALAPEETRGAKSGAELLPALVATGGAAAHALLSWRPWQPGSPAPEATA